MFTPSFRSIACCFILSFAFSASRAQINDSLKSMRYIENKIIKVGIDLNLGGAITYLSELNKENLINNWDWGRQVQMSFYSGPVPFEPDGKKANKAWTFIGWNPIQSGDVAGNRSKVLEYKNTGKELYVKCIPMHWPLDNVPGECTYECWIKLEDNTVKVRSRIVNNRPDTTQYAAREQELPAVYTNAPYHRLVSYRGNKPYSQDTISEIKNHNFPKDPSIRWASWQATESWAANVNENNYGLGIWNGGVQRFKGGYYGDSAFKGGSKNIPTAYIAPNSIDVLDYNITYDYNYVLIAGDLDQVRNYAYKHIPNQLPVYNFKNSRLQWHYDNTKDKGWPIKDGLHIYLNDKAALISPMIFWKATDASKLILEAAYTAGVKKARVYWSRFNDGKFEAAESIDFNVISDGKNHRYSIPLSSSANYTGEFNGLKILLAADDNYKDGGEVTIKSISLVR